MKQQNVTDEVTAVVEGLGLEIDRIEYAAAGRRTVVRVFVDGDGPEGHGPSLDEISDATRAISTALDASPSTGDAPYVLEVSSRGATRPLTQPKHFRRNTGRLVTLTLADGSASGRIVEAGEDALSIETEDGQQASYPYSAIEKAVVTVELKRMDEFDDGEDVVDDEEE